MEESHRVALPEQSIEKGVGEGNRSVAIIAIDFSGSTCGCENYHDLALVYERKYKEEHKELVYLMWNSDCFQKSEYEIETAHKIRDGDGGTEPRTIPAWIKTILNDDSRIPVDIMIITDGEIGRYDVEQCIKENRGINYRNVDFVIINKYIDMSVGAAFMMCANIRIYRNDQLFKTVSTTSEFDYNAINLDNFLNKASELRDYICVKYMINENWLHEADELTKLQKRLKREYLKQNQNRSSFENIDNERMPDVIIEWIKTLPFYEYTYSNHSSILESIESTISTLRNYLHTINKGFDFLELKMDHKLGNLEDAVEKPEPEIESIPTMSTIKFTDVISFEDSSIPVVFIYEYNLINHLWKDKNYKTFSTTVRCPLFLLYNDCPIIGHEYSIESYKSLLETEYYNLRDPINRAPSVGGVLPFEEANQYNDYILCSALFCGKLIPGISWGLLYFTLYKLIDKVQWVTLSVKEQFKQYAFKRLASGKTKLGIIAQSILDPDIMVIEPLACYYCVYISSLLFGEDSVNYKMERMRLFNGVAAYMMEILDHFGYSYDVQFVKQRSELFRYMNSLKRLTKKEEARYKIMHEIFETVSVESSSFLVPRIKVSKERVNILLSYMSYNHNEMLPFVLTPKYKLEEFVHLNYNSKFYSIQICEETMRPQFAININDGCKTFYYSYANTIVDYEIKDNEIVTLGKPNNFNISRGSSLFKRYGDYVSKNNRYPTLSEYAQYCLSKNQFYEGKVRLFAETIAQSINDIWGKYQLVIPSTVPEFINKFQSSLTLPSRIQMEGLTDNAVIEILIRERDQVVATDKFKGATL